MKLSKILMGAVAMSAVIGLASCGGLDKGGAISGNKVNFDNAYVKVTTDKKTSEVTVKSAKESELTKYNELTDEKKAELDYVVKANDEYYYRAFEALATKHNDAVCQITLKQNVADKLEGVAGFIFNLTENEDKSMNFSVAAVRTNGKKVDTYISNYTNVSLKDANFTTLSNFGDIDGVKCGPGSKAAETEILKGAGNDAYFHFTEANYALNEDNEVTVVIKVSQDDKGQYTVDYYTTDDLTVTGKIKEDAKSLKSQPVSSANTEKTQTKFARYANIYPGQKFTANFKFTDVNGNEIPMEFED